MGAVALGAEMMGAPRKPYCPCWEISPPSPPCAGTWAALQASTVDVGCWRGEWEKRGLTTYCRVYCLLPRTPHTALYTVRGGKWV